MGKTHVTQQSNETRVCGMGQFPNANMVYLFLMQNVNKQILGSLT